MQHSHSHSQGLLLPTFSDLMTNVCEGTFEPSASTYVFSSRKSVSLRVFVRIKVITTSAGMLTSAAPLSTIKSRSRLIKLSFWPHSNLRKGVKDDQVRMPIDNALTIESSVPLRELGSHELESTPGAF